MSRKKVELKLKFEQLASRYGDQWWGKVFKDALAQIEDFQRDTFEAAATAAESAQLPSGYQWGDEAFGQFNFGKERAALAIRALKEE